MKFRIIKSLSITGVMLYTIAGYLLINHISAERGHFINVSMALDASIPFIPEFVYGYILYFAIFAFYFVIDDMRTLRTGVICYLIICTAEFLFFILMPVRMTRPMVMNTGLAAELVRMFYTIDHPYNCFPSMHVTVTLIGGLVLWRTRKGWSIFFFAITAVISLSVLFIRQHFIADVAAAYAITIPLYLLISRMKCL